jgi:hypothetical protein
MLAMAGGHTNQRKREMPMVTRRGALFAGASMIVSIPFGAYAEEGSEPAPSEEAPPPSPPANVGPFSAPARAADQSKIGVSRVKVPKQGEGNIGAQIRPVKIYTAWEKKSAVIGPSGAEGGSPNGFFDGGEKKPESDFLAAKTK